MPIGSLTEREQQVLYVLATGRSYQDIATVLNVSIETVRTHVRHIYKKLQIHSRSEIGRTREG
jgi:DNA-binding NarL/FixJ family response regulator